MTLVATAPVSASSFASVDDIHEILKSISGVLDIKGFKGADKIQALADSLASNTELTELASRNPHAFKEVVTTAASRKYKAATNGIRQAEPVHVDLYAEDLCEVIPDVPGAKVIVAEARGAEIKNIKDKPAPKRDLIGEAERKRAAARSVTNETKEAGFWDRFKSGEYDKVNLAVGLVAAGLSAFGALQSATQIMSKDEQGRDHVNMSPLLWTLGQGAMAAGIAYLTLKAPQLTSAAARV